MLILRADANSRIGTGHLMRCLALAQSWRANGGEATFVTNCESVALRERLKIEGFVVVEIENPYTREADWLRAREISQNFSQAWCVVDGYHFDAKFHGLIRASGGRVLVVDDTAHLPFYDADTILNQNINAAELQYNCPPDTRLMLGTKYALLRSEFFAWQDWKRETPEVARKFLITMGGGDFHNQTLKVIRALGNLKIENLKARTVLGANYSHLPELERVVGESPVHIELIKSAENMGELMKWADVAVSAAGSTCWELAFMQVPSVLIVTAENQISLAAGLSKAAFALNLGWFEQVSQSALTVSLSAVSFDRQRRQKMSETGREIVDGRGAARTVKALRENA